MKKIAFLCGSLNRGGAERVAVSLSAWFSAKGYDTQIITANRGGNEYAVPAGVVRHVLTENGGGLRQLFNQIHRLRKLVKNVDTVIIMGVPLCIYGVPGCLGKAKKIIVSERNDPRSFQGKKIVGVLSKLLMKLCHGYVFQTRDALAYYDKKVKGQKAVIRNPLPADRLPGLYQGLRRKEIVAVGRLEPQKNHSLLLEAFAGLAEDYPDYHLTVYGEGVLRDRLESRIRELHLENRVSLPGNCPDVLEKIKDTSLFVMSSDFEGMPNALMEAMALGLPCISTDCPCGGPAEMISDGENGILTPVGDKAALAENIRKVLADSLLRDKLGTNAVALRQELTIERIGSQWEAIL